MKMAKIINTFVILLLPLFSIPLVDAAPVIKFDAESFDFGQIYEGEIATHVYKFKNTGNEDLYIKEVIPSCGCTAVLVSSKVIPPNGKGEIKANFQSSGFNGNVKKSIVVTSNDPAHPQTELKLSGFVRKDVEVIPGVLYFGIIRKGSPLVRETVLKNLSKEPIRITGFKYPSDFLKVKTSAEMIEAGKEAKIIVYLTENAPPGKLSQRIDIEIQGKPSYKVFAIGLITEGNP